MKKQLFLFLAVGIFVVTVAIVALVTGLTVQRNRVEFTTLDIGELSQLSDAPGQQALAGTVIYTPEQWTDFWERHTRGRDPAPLQPYVDFDTEMVIAVVLGAQPATTRVTISEVRVKAQRLVVRIQLRKPREGQILPAMLSTPFHIIKLSRFELPVEYHWLD